VAPLEAPLSAPATLPALTIDAGMVGDWQACRRRFIVGADWLPGRWRPKSLFALCLRRAIEQLTAVPPLAPREAALNARETFMTLAAKPGLEVYDVSPYDVAQSYCALLDTVVHGMSRQSLPVTRPLPPAPLSSTLAWRFTSPVDDAGALHRYVIVDSWSDDMLMREAHAWRTIGDLAVLRVPLTLHVVVLGQVRHHRHHSAWARAWRHPTIQYLPFRFVAKDPRAKGLKTWNAYWFADAGGVSAEDWVAQAEKEGALNDLTHIVDVRVPSDIDCDRVVRELRLLGGEMREALAERSTARWRELPMSRNACDGLVPCPFQTACYGDPVPLGSLGFIPRGESTAPKAPPSPRP
jgi:hypothetical protein